MGDIYTGADKLEAYLEHHGILGMKWGVRRYQPYTDAMTRANSKEIGEAARKVAKREAKAAKKEYKEKYKLANKNIRNFEKALKKTDKEQYKKERQAAKTEFYNKLVAEGEYGQTGQAYSKSTKFQNALFGAIGVNLKTFRYTNAQYRQMARGADMASKLDLIAAEKTKYKKTPYNFYTEKRGKDLMREIRKAGYRRTDSGQL